MNEKKTQQQQGSMRQFVERHAHQIEMAFVSPLMQKCRHNVDSFFVVLYALGNFARFFNRVGKSLTTTAHVALVNFL